MITVIEHPLVLSDLTILRDKNTETELFRKALKRISYHLAVETTKKVRHENTEVETDFEKTSGVTINDKIVVIPIMRAGFSLMDGFKELLPNYTIGYIGLRRDENTYQAEEYYYTVPKIDSDTLVIILDVMIATGGTMCSAISKLMLDGAERIKIATIIAAPEGMERVLTEYPKSHIVCATLDRELNANKYILPGLGDAGNRYAGITD